MSVPPPNMPAPVVRELPPAPPSRDPRLKLVASAALAVVLVVLAVIVFGGSAGRIVDPVAEAATLSSNSPGYRMHVSLEMTSSALPSPITATGEGSFDVRDRAGSMSLAMNLGGEPQVIQALGTNTLSLHEILDGTTVYVKLPAALENALTSSGKQWVAINVSKLTDVPGLASLESNPASGDPSQMLEYLRAASDSVVTEGRQVVDGRETTHYHADLSLDRVAGALPEADQSAARQALSTLEHVMQIDVIPVDVWVDAQHLVRRIQMTFDASISSGQTLDESMTIDISHYGPQTRPELPPADQVANLSSLPGSGG